ncbi:MAG: GFA family protein [Bdellovibrionaceae bacterium]|nr:GFA family protein [Pseudobdellovibrionaceae bacterium]
MRYTGSCHCQAVKFEIETEIKDVMSCNCSICQRRGHLLAFAPMKNFKILAGESALKDYQWGQKQIHFTFCGTCGCAPFGRGESPEGPMAAVNARCLDGVDLDTLTVTKFDGRHLL